METILTIILPVFGLVALGFATGRPPLFPGDVAKTLGTFIFYLALPALLFRSMAARGLPHVDELSLLAAYYSALVVTVLGSYLYARCRYEEPVGGAASLTLGACFSNLVLIGVPLTLSAYGQPGLQQMLLIATFHAAFLVGGATVLAEVGRAGQGGRVGRIAANTGIALAKNPVILAILGGLLFGTLGLRLPGPVDEALRLLGTAAVPTSLFALGASLVGLKVTDLVGRTLLMVTVKLLVLPCLVYLSGRFLFALPDLQLAVAVTCASLPAGMNAFLFAQRYGLHPSRVASATLLTTILSAVTTGLIIDYFRTML